ncbi:MAG TPA: hypothetical protein ACFCUY_16460, partial [Xenococcaceae cyanobacterium]
MQNKVIWWQKLVPKRISPLLLLMFLGLAVSVASPIIAKFLTASPLSALNWQGWLTIGVTIGLLLLNAATSL